jgi:hypothetical protein
MVIKSEWHDIPPCLTGGSDEVSRSSAPEAESLMIVAILDALNEAGLMQVNQFRNTSGVALELQKAWL